MNIFEVYKNIHDGAKNFGDEKCICLDHKEEYELVFKNDNLTGELHGVERRCSNCSAYLGIIKDSTNKVKTEVLLSWTEKLDGFNFDKMLNAVVAQTDEDGDDYTVENTPSVEVNGKIWRK